MANVLITGVNGTIGSQVARFLLSQGHRILGLDDSAPPLPGLSGAAPFTALVWDITRAGGAPPEAAEADVLIHCAALVHKRSKDLSRDHYFEVNVQGTKNVLSALDVRRVRQVVFLSTVSVYGGLSQTMVPNEETPPAPEDFYGESKLAAEGEIRTFGERGRVPYTIFRLAPVYGRDFLLNIEKRIYVPRKVAFYQISGGRQKMSLCSMGNVVKAVAESLSGPGFRNQTFIVKDAKDYAVKDIISAFKSYFGQQARPVIPIPLRLPELVFGCFGLIRPQTGKFFKYQLKKIARDSIYSGKKIHSLGIPLTEGLKETYSRVYDDA